MMPEEKTGPMAGGLDIWPSSHIRSSALRIRSRSIGARASKGFTLIELVIVITIIVSLATAFINRVWFYQEEAEKAAMEEVVNVLQSALVMQYGYMMIHNTQSGVAALTTDNPMSWLSKLPRNYAGEFSEPTVESVAPGNWMFDLSAHELVYVIDRGDYFTPGADGKRWIRYRVNLRYDANSGVPGNDGRVLSGVLIEPVAPYRWLDQETLSP
jgi:general secretion pathway protein G